MSRARAWLLAARPATLWAAVVPVLVGSGLAWGAGRDLHCPDAEDCLLEIGVRIFRWDALLITLVAALAIQVGTNFANDVADARRGADTSDRIGPPRVVAEGILPAGIVWRATWLAFGLAALCGLYLAFIAGWAVIAIGVVSILAALGYVGGPKPYGYAGLGEVFVFIFFGLVATVGSRFVHDGRLPSGEAWRLAIPVGLLVTAILVVNNIRDIETDAAAGKRTLAVILGRSTTARLYAALVAAAFLLITIFGTWGIIPRWSLLALAAVPLAIRPTRAVFTETAGPPLIGALKATALLHLAVGVLLAVGAALG
ncbi:MAG: 1,4-dihydroxy-2-naphthoate polyprenyltransferase [Dehalococcoidia bacterium]